MKKVLLILLILFVLFLGYSILKWDSEAPSVQWVQAAEQVGRQSEITLKVTDEGRGLKGVEVSLVQGDKRRTFLVHQFPSLVWPWERGTMERSISFKPFSVLGTKSPPGGKFEIEVRAADQSNLLLWNHQTVQRKTFQLDLTPPQIQVLSRQHYIHQGGSEAILYWVSDDTVQSGVQVGGNVFVGYPVSRRGKGVYLCLFALAYNQPADTEMYLWAEDGAGNRGRSGFWEKTFATQFRKRKINVSDSFLQSAVPEIVANSSDVRQGGTLLDTYIDINSRLRKVNHQQIVQISRKSADHLLWDKPFLQLSNSQVESAFADNRTYFYKGKVIDHETHLGFDLASMAHSPVECANDGVVLYAAYLGIYGNCVIVDHGMGLVSLYGHLSRMEVKPGEPVKRGQELGRTGQTGLAGGDHLHFTLLLQGIEVNPIEWWDPKWVKEHVLSKLKAEDTSSGAGTAVR